MNHVTLIGNLTKDPELRQTGAGHSVCTFTLAVQRKLPKDAERQADFLPVVCWRKLGEVCAKHLQKGSKVAVTGKMQSRSYEAGDGGKRTATEVIADEVEFLDRVKAQEEAEDDYPY